MITALQISSYHCCLVHACLISYSGLYLCDIHRTSLNFYAIDNKDRASNLNLNVFLLLLCVI